MERGVPRFSAHLFSAIKKQTLISKRLRSRSKKIPNSELKYDLSVNGAGKTCGVALVGVDVHCGSVFGADAADHVAEGELSAGAHADLNGNDLLVNDAVFLGGLGVKVQVTLSGDHAVIVTAAGRLTGLDQILEGEK